MALFSSGKKHTPIVKKVRPTVVKTENVAKELASIAKEYGIKQENLDFNILDVRSYTRFLRNGNDGEWEEVDNENLNRIDDSMLLDPNFQIKQVYEVEIFSRQRSKNPLDEFKIAIGANATKCKVYMQIKEGSILRYFAGFKEELRSYIDKHKVRAGILIYISDKMLDDVVSKLSAKVQLEDMLLFEKSETILIAQSIEPTPTEHGTLILRYEEHKSEEDAEKKVDYADRGFIQSVHKDELLIEYIKPRPGRPGRDCRGRYIAPREPSENSDITFDIDESTIYIKEDDESIKYFAKENGYIAFEDNIYTIKSEADVDQVSFKTTGSITVGTDSDVNLVVTEADALKDAIDTGMRVEVAELDVEGNVGSDAKVKALKATVGGQTHKSSVIEADDVDINIHKGTVRGKNVRITRLEHGTVEAETVQIAQAIGGKIYAENVLIELCGSYVRIHASHKIEIKKLRGSENIFVIDPLQQRKTKEGYEKNKEEIQELEEKLLKSKKSVDEYTKVVKKNYKVFNDIKKRLLHYKKNGIKLPEAYVKQYKIYQAQIDKLKELKEQQQRLEEKLHLLANQTDTLQYNILDARIINHDKWIGYNELRAKLLDPPLELIYKPQENEPNHIYGVVEIEEGIFKLQPLREEL